MDADPGCRERVQILRLLRVVRVLRVQRMFWYMDSAVNRQIFIMCLAIVSLAFVWAGAIHFIENTLRSAAQGQLMLHDVFCEYACRPQGVA